MSVRIWIGGQLIRSRAELLLRAIRQSNVNTGSPGWEHVRCQPVSVEGLLEGLPADGVLHLQHPQGQLAKIVDACRTLGLTYRLWRSDPPVVELWAPGMEQRVRLHGLREDPQVELVEAGAVRRAIKLLQKNKACLAKHTLLEACPEVPQIPPLEVVER